MVARTLGKQQTVMAIATKIALQMNCKMGGELWRVDMPVSPLCLLGRVLLLRMGSLLLSV